jgi:hypothetical protein
MKIISILTAAAVSVLLAAPAFATGAARVVIVDVRVQTPTCHGTCTTGGATGTATAAGDTTAVAYSHQFFTGTSTTGVATNTSTVVVGSHSNGTAAGVDGIVSAGGSVFGGSGASYHVGAE